jgi:N-acetylmuramoyl-L-alanine amidase
MAVKYPKAEWRPLGKQIQPTMSGHDIIVIHTMARSLAKTDSGFKLHGYRGLEAHFGTGQHGELYQWQDLARTADACYHGNDICISIENEDTSGVFPHWEGSDVPAFTYRQLATLVDLCAWLCDKYDIPAEEIPNSLPGNRGIGWHRMGVVSKPPHRRGYLVDGGVQWSDKVGKVCPGDRRIRQIRKIIIPDVQATLNNEPLPVPLRKDDTMKIIRLHGTSHCYLANGIQRKHLKGRKDLAVAKQLLKESGQSTKVIDVAQADLDFYGILVGGDFAVRHPRTRVATGAP